MRPIDADELMQKYCGECDLNEMFCLNCKYHELRVGIKNAPTIEAEPIRHARWIPTEYDAYADGAPVWDKWECSECGHEHSGEENTLTAFCPDCGARMDGKE